MAEEDQIQEQTPEQVAAQQSVVDELLRQVNRARAEVEQIIGKKVDGPEEFKGQVSQGDPLPFQTSAFDHFAGDIKKALPAMMSQAQLRTFGVAFEALRLVANSIFAGDVSNEIGGRQALDKACDAMKQATLLTNKLEDVPEAAEGGLAQEMKAPLVDEAALLVTLLEELDAITTYSDLINWYGQNRTRFDQLKYPTRRNGLFDAIGAKKAQLQR